MIEVNESDRYMLAILPEGHTVLAVEPCGKPFIGSHQPFALDGEENCPEFVDHLICCPVILCNLRVDFFKGFNKLWFNENIRLISWQIFS